MLLQHVQVFTVIRPDGETWRFTTLNARHYVNGLAYQPLRGGQVSTLEARVGGGIDTLDLTLSLQGADGAAALAATQLRPSAAEIVAGVWEGTQMTCTIVDWGRGIVVREFPTFVWTDTQLQGKTALITCETLGAVQANRQTGTVITPTCRYGFGDADCAIDRSTHRATMTVDAITATEITGTVPDPAPGTWAGGHVVTDGRRTQIALATSGALILVAPLHPAPVPGDTITLEAGCDKTVAMCKAFDNFDRFGGAGHLTPSNESTQVQATEDDGIEYNGGSRFAE